MVFKNTIDLLNSITKTDIHTAKYIPTKGTYARFFTEKVPRVIGPNSIGFMGQPDGSTYAVGGPFYRYTNSVNRNRVNRTRVNRNRVNRNRVTGSKPIKRKSATRKTLFGFNI